MSKNLDSINNSELTDEMVDFDPISFDHLPEQIQENTKKTLQKFQGGFMKSPNVPYYYLKSPSLTAIFKESEILFRIPEYGNEHSNQENFDFENYQKYPSILSITEVSLKFPGSYIVEAMAENPSQSRFNYFKGEKIDWIRNSPYYQTLIYQNLYDGIDLIYDLKNGELKYEFRVKPGSDYHDIQLEWNGDVTLTQIEQGLLFSIETSNTIYPIIDSNPINYLEDLTKTSIQGEFKILNEKLYGFEIEDYDRSKELVIDPMMDIESSNLLGGSGNDYGYAIALDSSNNIYVTGYTADSVLEFPTTSGTYNETYTGGNDVFVSKLSSDGSTLLFSTLIGGSGIDYVNDIIVDSSNNVYITGYTFDDTIDFPTTAGAYNESISGETDAFVTKISSDGSQLLFSTLLGGSFWDQGYALTVDDSGNVYVVGYSNDALIDFPTTSGTYSEIHSGIADAFITKLSSDGSTILFSTLFGGSLVDYAYDIALDASLNIYITGKTNSNTDFPTTIGAYNETHSGGYDAFIAKFSSDASTLIFGTYVGGTSNEDVSQLALDDSNNVLITGNTDDNDLTVPFPTTSGVYDETHNGRDDVFVTKLSSDGASLVFSTIIGGSHDDIAAGIELDTSNNIYITGTSMDDTVDFPTTSGAYNEQHNGHNDVFVAQLSPNGASLIFSTFLGTTGSDVSNDIELDASRKIYITGSTFDTPIDFPTTVSAYNTINNGGHDAFITKLLVEETSKPDITATNSLVYDLGSTGNEIGWTLGDYSPWEYNITLNDSPLVNQIAWSNGTLELNVDNLDIGIYNYTIYVNDYWGNANAHSILVIVTHLDIGTDLWFSTLIGGSDNDMGNSISLDSLGNIIITGLTIDAVNDFPTSSGSYTESHQGAQDIFVTKLSPDGTNLIFSTFIGGSDNDYVLDLILDSSDNIYLTGNSLDSTIDYPTTNGVNNETHNGKDDIIVSKLASDGSDLIFSTFVGGSESDIGVGISLDISNNVYVTGSTNSTSDFPTTGGVYNETHSGGYDVFVIKILSNGAGIEFSGLIGGSSDDVGYHIALDGLNKIYISGTATLAAQEFPTTVGAYDENHNGVIDVFILKFSADGSSLEFSSFLGGIGADIVLDFTLDSNDTPILAGATSHSSFPVTPDAFDESHNGGFDGFICKLSSDGSTLQYSTFIGGSTEDYVRSLTLDQDDNVYITGHSYSVAIPFPTTAGSYNETNNGGADTFVSMLSFEGTTLIFSTLIGGSGDDIGMGIVRDAKNFVYIMGYTTDSVTDYPTTQNALNVTHNGMIDVFLTKLIIQDFISPDVTPSGDTGYEFTNTGNEISWNVGDVYPDHYNLTLDGNTLYNLEPWSNGSITLQVDNLGVGEHNYTLYLQDYWGNTVTDSIIVTVVDTVNPDLSLPSPQTIELGVTGNQIIWNVGDLLPDSYYVTLDGQNYTESTWINGSINVDFDNLSLGTHEFTIYVFDTSSNQNSNTVLITIEDTTNPIVAASDDVTYEYGDSGNTISWLPTDLNAGSYVIEKDGENVDSDNWISNQAISYPVDGLTPGSYNFTIIVMDGSGNTVYSTIIVDVEDTISPEIISIDNTLENEIDLIYEFGSTGNSITWIASDLDPDDYEIYRNGTLLRNGTWVSNDPISVTVNGLSVGYHNITIIFKDKSDNFVVSTLIIQVVDTVRPVISSERNREHNQNVIAGGTYTVIVEDVGIVSYIEYKWNSNGQFVTQTADTSNLSFDQTSTEYFFTIPVPLELANTEAILFIIAYDESGNPTTTQIEVTILSELPSEDTPILLDNETIQLIVLIIGSLLLLYIILKLVRRGSGRKYAGQPIPMEDVEVFISYSSKETRVAEDLYDALFELELNPWIALDNIAIGEQYNEEIIRAIDGSKIFIILVSKNSVGSRHVGTELERAFSKNKKLFPVRLDDCELPIGWEYFLSQSQWKDYSDHKKTDWVYELASMIEQNLKPLRDASLTGTGLVGATSLSTTGIGSDRDSQTTFETNEKCLFCDTPVNSDDTKCTNCGQFDPFLKRPLKRGESWTTCYNCYQAFHRGTFLEWVRTKGRCPSCKAMVQESRYTDYLSQSEVAQKIKATITMELGIQQDDYREISKIERNTVNTLDEFQKIYHTMLAENAELRQRMDDIERTVSESQDKVLGIIQPIVEEVVRITELTNRLEADMVTQDQFNRGIQAVTRELDILEDQIDLLFEYHRKNNSMRQKIKDNLKSKVIEVGFDTAMEETGIQMDLDSYSNEPTKFKLNSIIGKIKYGLKNSVGDPKKWLKLTSLLFFI